MSSPRSWIATGAGALACAVVSLLSLFSWSSTAASASRTPEPRARPATAREANVIDLEWLSGRWVRETDDQFLEESWSEPVGDAMVGVFRWAREESFWLYELMSIEEEDGSLVFRLRHFHRGLEIWKSELESPLTYPLSALEENEVIFENPERDSPRRFVYRREGDRLTVAVEGPEPGSGDRFQFELTP
jgi:hypothetical protein